MLICACKGAFSHVRRVRFGVALRYGGAVNADEWFCPAGTAGMNNSAASSLPVPVSPVMSTVLAEFAIRAMSRLIAT